MLPFRSLKDTNIMCDVIKTNKKCSYLNIATSFDIETSSTPDNEDKVAFAYIWGFCIDGHSFYGRTWEEFVRVCNHLQKRFSLSVRRRMIVYVHNLSYEFQFMRKYFNWVEVFSVDIRKPLKALTTQGIEFRCSYILSGYNLANTAKNLKNSSIRKLVGDLDYDLMRHEETPITETEMRYLENDVAIVVEYIKEQMSIYGDITKIPLTNTGRVRSYVKHECYYNSTNHKKSSRGKYDRYRNIMNDLTLDSDTYIQLKRAFMGGFTHSNANYTGKVLNNVSSVDFTSSYPSVMLSEKFPMSRFKLVTIESSEHFHELLKTRAVVFDVMFENIETKITQESYISSSKCSTLEKPVVNNGRVFSAEKLTTTITEQDFFIMEKVYSWGSMKVSNVRVAYKNYLPKPILKCVLELYQKKTVLKDVEGSEVEYMLGKGMLNSTYGMCVTDIVKDSVKYEGEWGVEKISIDAEIEKYNKSRNRFLYYAWGIWVTAYARRNLYTGILACGDDYVYSDTDSIKILNYSNHLGYIEWFNKLITNKLEKMCDEMKFDKNLLRPKTIKGKEKPIGVWDYEGEYSRFKTLGAKRYLVENNGKLHLTVAGLSKQNGVEFLLEKNGNDNTKVFEAFNDDMYIPADRTGKMTHTYIDREIEYECVDYLGNKKVVIAKSGVHLSKCDFTLSLSRQYLDFIKNLSRGYIYNGVSLI